MSVTRKDRDNNTRPVHGGSEEILFPKLPYRMKDRITQALADEQLQAFVNGTTTAKDEGRKAILEETFGQRLAGMKDLAGWIKQHTLDHLDWYLAQWVENAEVAGTVVHYARDAEQAGRIVAELAKARGCRLCVKSKSMVTEEVGLVKKLAEVGCEAVETDLGEFILQVDDDAPSHIVTPMIHKDRKAVARAFVRELGVEYTEDAEQLTQIARQHLRQKYREADMGVSGANFMVAETGSVVLCTNEGNGRLCTSVPRLHVAVAGIEKLVPGLHELTVLLKLLARSSTAQPLTVYTHIMTGPRREGEADGPEEMHVVLVDNGRTEVLGGEGREALRCIRCGACLNVCPVYRQIGGHAYGSVYSGPIGSILTSEIKGVTNYPDLAHASSLCGACYDVCPVRIDIPRQLIRLRGEMVKKHEGAWLERATLRIWGLAMRWGWTHRIMQRVQRVMIGGLARHDETAHDPYRRRGWTRRLPGMLKGWTNERDMPGPAERDFRQWWNERKKGDKT